MGAHGLPTLGIKTLGSQFLCYRELEVGTSGTSFWGGFSRRGSSFGLVSRNTQYNASAPAPAMHVRPGIWELRCYPKVGRSQRTPGTCSQCRIDFCIVRKPEGPVQPLSKMTRRVHKAGIKSTCEPHLGRGFPPPFSWATNGASGTVALANLFFPAPDHPL